MIPSDADMATRGGVKFYVSGRDPHSTSLERERGSEFTSVFSVFVR